MVLLTKKVRIKCVIRARVTLSKRSSIKPARLISESSVMKPPKIASHTMKNPRSTEKMIPVLKKELSSKVEDIVIPAARNPE